MTAPTIPAATLVVGDWESRCTACGAGADIQTHHATTLTPDGPVRGCGARYAGVALSRDANQVVAGNVRLFASQLELPYAGRWPAGGDRGSVDGGVVRITLGAALLVAVLLYLCGNWSAL